jgi:hypothetical protein
MSKLYIYRAKPNPAGKDASHHHAKPEQLLGEWVDLQNTNNYSVSLGGLSLDNQEYDHSCIVTNKYSTYWRGSYLNVVGPGQIVRVHTGKSADQWSMKVEDRNGADLHVFAEREWFVLNNRCGDCVTLWSQDSEQKFHREDSASYDPNPPDGAVLMRSGDKLIVGLGDLLSALTGLGAFNLPTR